MKSILTVSVLSLSVLLAAGTPQAFAQSCQSGNQDQILSDLSDAFSSISGALQNSGLNQNAISYMNLAEGYITTAEGSIDTPTVALDSLTKASDAISGALQNGAPTSYLGQAVSDIGQATIALKVNGNVAAAIQALNMAEKLVVQVGLKNVSVGVTTAENFVSSGNNNGQAMAYMQGTLNLISSYTHNSKNPPERVALMITAGKYITKAIYFVQTE
jgi:hypothetical protein